MMRFVRNILFLFSFLPALHVNAQDITGTWEGRLDNEQFLQLNIIQTGNKICGYTRDHVIADDSSYCKAFFEGYFDKQKQKLYITGKYFIENSGSHSLMQLSLNYQNFKGTEVLEERPRGSSLILGLLNPFGNNDDGFSDLQFEAAPRQFVYLKKVSSRPKEMNELMRDCIAGDKVVTFIDPKKTPPLKPKDSSSSITKKIPPKISKDPLKARPVPPVKKEKVPVTPPVVINKTTPAKPKVNAPIVTKKPVPKIIKDSVKVKPAAPLVKKDSVVSNAPVVIKRNNTTPLPKSIAQRKNREQSRITVNTKSINLKVYDNAVMDGDTVSILYNGRYLLSRKLLTEKGIEINLELEDQQTRHEIVLFAHNLGSIPPNTALIVITAGEKRYELFASASLEENAVLVFEYKPK